MASIIGVRREDKNPWERRVPLIPSHVRELQQEHGLDFIIQPSPIRIFRDEDYEWEGTRVQEDLSPASVVLAVKEIPIPLLREDTTYLFFSHTIKGQTHNRPMLKRLIELGCTLIDYERIVDEKGRRLLFFGTQAGQAGLIDGLWALGRRLALEKIASPFDRLLQTFHYTNLVEAKEEIARTADEIREKGLPEPLVPFVTGFTGYGHVSRGAQDIYDLLPSVEILPEDFGGFISAGHFSRHRVYKVVFHEHHMVRPIEAGRLFDLHDYYRNPEHYEAILEPFLRHLTVLINGIFWAPPYPHFVSKAFIKTLYGTEDRPRLQVIADISCDVEGGVECTLTSTNSKDPVFVYDPVSDTARLGFEGRGPVIMAVDNLPAEIALESSIFFSSALKPYVPALAWADFETSFEACALPDPIRRAVILYKGKFTPDFLYMKEFVS